MLQRDSSRTMSSLTYGSINISCDVFTDTEQVHMCGCSGVLIYVYTFLGISTLMYRLGPPLAVLIE